MRTILLLSILVIGSILPPGAHNTAIAAPADETFEPAQQLRSGFSRLLAFMRQEPTPPAARIARFLDTQIAPFFDFEQMARLAAGRFYTNLSKAKQVRMEDEIKRMLLTRLTENLVGYQGQQVRYLPPRFSNDERTAYITVYIINPVQYPARIDFRMQRRPNSWVITDVAANGQSAIVHYRRELAQRFMREMYQAMQYPR